MIVYNFVREGSSPLGPLDVCEWHGFDNLQEIYEQQQEQRILSKASNNSLGLIKPNFGRVRQLTRLTLVVSQGTYIH